MDNATVHMHPGVKEAIEAKGAYLIYGAPYSPDKNPIEKMFSVYKTYLKRYEGDDWVRRHELSLEAVTPKKAKNFFRKCSVPGVQVSSDVADNNLVVVQNMNMMMMAAIEFNLI